MGNVFHHVPLIAQVRYVVLMVVEELAEVVLPDKSAMKDNAVFLLVEMSSVVIRTMVVEELFIAENVLLDKNVQMGNVLHHVPLIALVRNVVLMVVEALVESVLPEKPAMKDNAVFLIVMAGNVALMVVEVLAEAVL